MINPFCGLSVIFCCFISHLIGRETINIPEIFSGVHSFTGKSARACLHVDRVTLLGGLPFYKGRKIAPLYMQSLVPRAIAIAIIEFDAEEDSCAVAKYKTTKMADKLFAVHILKFFSRFLDNFWAKIFGKTHRHASPYFCMYCG